MAAVPFWTLALLNRPASGARPVAEAVFAILFAVTATYATFNEGLNNWQSLWTSAAYFLLGTTLWQARSVAVAGIEATKAGTFSEIGSLALNPIGVALALEPTAHGGAVGMHQNRPATDK